MNETYHEMILEKIHLSGVEEWHCPICGRHFLVQWPPAYKMIVVEPGEKDTRHNLSRVAARVGPRPVTQLEATDYIDEYRLIPWLEWMEKVDFASRWDD
jgi:hypothetical protein